MSTPRWCLRTSAAPAFRHAPATFPRRCTSHRRAGRHLCSTRFRFPCRGRPPGRGHGASNSSLQSAETRTGTNAWPRRSLRPLFRRGAPRGVVPSPTDDDAAGIRPGSASTASRLPAESVRRSFAAWTDLRWRLRGGRREDLAPDRIHRRVRSQPAPSQGGGTALNLFCAPAPVSPPRCSACPAGNVAHRSGSAQRCSARSRRPSTADPYQEADRCRVFDLNEIERAHGEGFEPSGVRGLGVEWDARRELLCASLAAQDVGAVENVLADMRELNRGTR